MGTLPAGPYRTNFFVPQLILTLPDGWSQFFPDEDDEIYMHDANAELAISRPAKVRDPVTREAVDAPEDLMAWLVANPDLNVTEDPTEIDGDMPGSWIEPAPTRSVNVYAFPGGDFRFVPGERQRAFVIPLDGPDLAVTIMAPEGGNLAEALDSALTIVESIQIEP